MQMRPTERKEGNKEEKMGGMYSVAQKNSCMVEFPAFLPPTNIGLPMHSQSALTEHVSLNLA